MASEFNPFDEYKLLLEDTTRLGDRRQLMNNIYLSVNSVLLGALALLVQQGKLTSFLILTVEIIVAIAGFVIAGQWHTLITRSRRLLGLRFRAMHAFEESPLFPGTIKIFHQEDTLYTPGARKGASYIEERLPRMFQYVYAVGTLALLLGTVGTRYHWFDAILLLLQVPPA